MSGGYFDASDDERRRILAEELLAIPTELKTEIHRIPACTP
jgi:hypothetical protein